MTSDILLLLIEDDLDDREIFLQAALEVSNTIRCLTASDGDEGLAVLNDRLSFLPDFIFLDLNLPGENGKEVLKKIKENPSFKDIPVIIYTTTSSPDEARECISLGANSFITKPHNFADIKETISRVVIVAQGIRQSRVKKV